jgi:hypothetical protein
MVIFKVDINRAFARPAERDAMVSGNADGPSPRLALQAVEPVPGQVHFLRLRRDLKQLKDAGALPDMFATDPACRADAVNLFKILYRKQTVTLLP